MKLQEISKPNTVEALNENLSKKFGQTIKVDAFTLEQLQDARNKIRTKISQFETNESYDSVLKDSNYQKNKLFLDVLNTAIAERGEIEEKEDQDNDGDNDFDDVKIARMMASGMSKPEAIAKIKGKKMKEGISPVPRKGKCPPGWELSPDGSKCLRKKLAGKGQPNMQMSDSVLKDEGKAIIENYFKHLLEGEEDKAEIVMAAKDMVDRVTSWMEDTAEMQAESMLELGDAIRDEMGQAQSETYIQTVKPGLESLYQSLEATRASLTSGVAKLTGEEEPAVDMGAEAPGMDAGMDAEEPMAEPEDDFGAAEPAAGGEEEAGRAKRESIQRSVRIGQILSSKKK